jgi:hypothetical protein
MQSKALSEILKEKTVIDNYRKYFSHKGPQRTTKVRFSIFLRVSSCPFVAILLFFTLPVDNDTLLAEKNISFADIVGYRAGTSGYRADIDGYHAETDGYRADIDGYHAETNGYRTEVDGYHAETDGYRAETDGYRAETDLYPLGTHFWP